MKTVKFLSIEKIKALQKSMGWLSNYMGPDNDETHVVGESINGNDEKIQNY